MLTTHGRLTRGLVATLAVVLGAAAGLFYVSSVGGSPAGQAQAAADIVQVTPEGGTHYGPSLLEMTTTTATTTATTTRLMVAYTGNPSGNPWGVHTKTSDDGGATWSAPVQVTGGTDGYSPDTAQAPHGTLWLVYQRCCRWQIYYQTSTDDGASWSGERLLPDSPYDRVDPTVAVTPTGRVIVAWHESDKFGRLVHYSYSDDAGST